MASLVLRLRSSHSLPSLIRDVLRVFSLRDPHLASISLWDLYLFLASLRKDHYEPLPRSQSRPSPWLSLPQSDLATSYTLSAVWIKFLPWTGWHIIAWVPSGILARWVSEVVLYEGPFWPPLTGLMSSGLDQLPQPLNFQCHYSLSSRRLTGTLKGLSSSST